MTRFYFIFEESFQGSFSLWKSMPQGEILWKSKERRKSLVSSCRSVTRNQKPAYAWIIHADWPPWALFLPFTSYPSISTISCLRDFVFRFDRTSIITFSGCSISLLTTDHSFKLFTSMSLCLATREPERLEPEDTSRRNQSIFKDVRDELFLVNGNSFSHSCK